MGAKAGVSIGSVYQYFTSKEALLSAIIGRESAPLLRVTEELSQTCSFHAAI
ncbi:TetR/AcrR family transcriptional regulator [Acidisarcina polymorpha]|uniref:TetR/AcrR family transcriptional regulator n=1 Tax=Acidisarcina polymorpha TaxID=2211140 RepID=UPI000DEEC587